MLEMAGIVEKGENLASTASRELMEETGHGAKKFEKLGEFFANSTGSSMKYHIFLADQCNYEKTPVLEAAEQIELFPVQNISEAENILFAPDVKTSSGTMAALSYLKRRLNNITQ